MIHTKNINTELRQTANVINALNYIWHNPGKNLNLGVLSKECNTSRYHFHRIFREHQNETLNTYISRKRLEFSANHLVMFPYFSISQIASFLGYSSSSNFSRAFKRHFGVTAREWRNPKIIESIMEGEIKSKYGKSISPKLNYSEYYFLDDDHQKNRLETLDKTISFIRLHEQTLMYLAINNSTDTPSVSQAWNDVINFAKNNFEDWYERLFSAWYDNNSVCPDHSMRHDAAILIPKSLNTELPFMKQTMDAGIYATGVLVGNDEELSNTARDIYMLWFRKKRIIPDLKPYYIQYLNDPKADGFYKIRFFIKIYSNYSIQRLKLSDSIPNHDNK